MTQEISIEDANLDKKGQIQEIKDAIENLSKEEGNHVLVLNLASVTGSLHHAMEIIHAIHESSKVDLHINAKGSLGLAGTVLTASAQPGFRNAEYGTTFILSNNEYAKDGKGKLSKEDQTACEILGKLTGKKNPIKKYLLNDGKIDAKQAKKCNILDNVSEFKSKYFKPKVKVKRESKGNSNQELSDLQASSVSEVGSETLNNETEAEIKTTQTKS